MTKVCSECGGPGKVEEVLPCTTCKGAGFIPGKPPRNCSNAKCRNGQVTTGKKITCTNCQGSGWEPEIDW